MASIRKRSWKRGTQRLSAFVVDYTDADGRRRLQTFNSENAAVAFKKSIIHAMAREKMKEDAEREIEPVGKLELLWGARAIAKFINRPTRATFHMLNKGLIPAKLIGNRWVASASDLAKSFR